MKTGDIVLIPFPFAEFSDRKVRPSVVVCETGDKYRDVVLCAISSVVPSYLSGNEFVLQIDAQNGLRKESVVKVDRIVTAKSKDIIAKLGKMSVADVTRFRDIFKALVDDQ